MLGVAAQLLHVSLNIIVARDYVLLMKTAGIADIDYRRGTCRSSIYHVFMQTLYELHCGCGLCHLDLSPSNIMLLWDTSDPWDSIRLIDFGFASKFNIGKLGCNTC